MKSQPKTSSRGVIQSLFAIFLLLFLSFFMVSNAQARKPQPAPGPTGPANQAIWGAVPEFDSDILEQDWRTCATSQVAPDQSSGTYSCPLDHTRILYDLSMMESTPIHRRGEDWRCSRNMYFHVYPDVEYAYSWNGNCPSGCEVSIVNEFSVLNTSVSRVRIEGFGVVTTNELNPFNVPQFIDIDYLHVTLFGVKGKNKVIAVCELIPRESNPVTFVTTPVE